MGKARRLQLIKSIEKARDSRVIAYVTSSRPGLGCQMVQEHVRILFDHIQAAANKKIDLFLHSDGGDAIVPWRLVNLIRECASSFGVLVPYRAFSAATLTALGADEIVMHPMGNLGPTDPTVTNQFNPRDEVTKSQLGINVEDVNAYIQLIKEDVGIQHQDELIQAFNVLADKVHPLALGNVKRFLSQSRQMAKKILLLHMAGSPEEHRVDELVESFTSKLFYHGHPINRQEAMNELGMKNVKLPSRRLEKAMWNLYMQYERELQMSVPFDPAVEFIAKFPNLKPKESKITGELKARRAFIESTNRTDIQQFEYQIFGEKQDSGAISWSMNILSEGWIQEQ
ncbi:MAG: hypothetical protein GY832_24450 [Chloroflexi bacterium]|nr:hypothetical protein [Chloroflexota bacterium]